MKFISILAFTLFIFSCGVELEIPETNQNVSFGPDFEGAAEFCDERYENEIEAEKCFNDYREYLSITIGLDLSDIFEYCESHNNTEEEIITCEEQLTSILGGF